MKLDYWWQGLLLVGVMIFALTIIFLPIKYYDEYSNHFEGGSLFGLAIGCMSIGFGYWMQLNQKNEATEAEPSKTKKIIDRIITNSLIVVGFIMVISFSIVSIYVFLE